MKFSINNVCRMAAVAAFCFACTAMQGCSSKDCCGKCDGDQKNAKKAGAGCKSQCAKNCCKKA